MPLVKVMIITFIMLLLSNEEGTELTTAQEVPSISVAATICEPAAVFTVLTLSAPAPPALFRESKTGAMPASIGSEAEERFIPVHSLTLLRRTSLLSLLII